MKSDFGAGLSYCLALFLCHSERSYGNVQMKFEEEQDKRMRKNSKTEDYSFSTEIWFNGSSDHLYDLQVPKSLPSNLQKRLLALQRKSIRWGHGITREVTKENKEWAINEAKDLIRLLDKHWGIETQKGQWQ